MRGFGAPEQVFSVFCSVYLSQAIAFLAGVGSEADRGPKRREKVHNRYFMLLYVSGKRGFLFGLLFPWLGGPGRRGAAAFTHVPNDSSGAVL